MKPLDESFVRNAGNDAKEFPALTPAVCAAVALNVTLDVLCWLFCEPPDRW